MIQQFKTMQEWGILTDYRYSYSTNQPSYEANVIERFADLQRKGMVQAGQRPVYFSVQTQKILSEDEIVNMVELRDSVVMKAAMTNFGLNSRLEEAYPDLKLLLWTNDCWQL